MNKTHHQFFLYALSYINIITTTDYYYANKFFTFFMKKAFNFSQHKDRELSYICVWCDGDDSLCST